jgi:hypothetical protein
MIDPRIDPEEDIVFDKALKAFDLSQRSQVRSSLRQRLVTQAQARRTNQQGETRMHPRKLFYTLSLTVSVLVLLLFAAFSPPVKAMAQDLLRQVGQFVLVARQPVDSEVVYDPEQAERDAARPTAVAPAFEPITVMDLGEASQAAGFTGRAPANLPEGYTLEHRQVNALPNGIGLFSVYQNATGQRLTVLQAQYQPGTEAQEFWVGGTRVNDINVRGQNGVWIEDMTMAVQDTSEYLQKRVGYLTRPRISSDNSTTNVPVLNWGALAEKSRLFS